MPIRNSGGGSALDTAQRTLYVSPSFTNTSPFFSTIQAAINAADGVNPYNIIIFVGDYSEQVTGKHNVSLIGVDRWKCRVVGRGLLGNNISFTSTAANQFFSLANLTSVTDAAGNHAYEVLDNHNGLDIRVWNCTLDGRLSQSGFKYTNNFGAGTQIIDCQNSHLQGKNVLPDGGLLLDCNQNGPGYRFVNCIIDQFEHVYRCNDFAFDHCVFNTCGIFVPDAGYVKRFRHCVFNSSAMVWNGGGFADALMEFENCVLTSSQITYQAGAGVTYWKACEFYQSGALTPIFVNSGSTGLKHVVNCHLHNGKILFQAALGASLYRLTNTIIEGQGGGAANVIDGGGFANQVFLGNVSMDGVIGNGAVATAGSYNVNAAVLV